MKAPEYLAINPMGKVPAIRHDATVVTENAAICAYLADAFPDAGLAPPPGSSSTYNSFWKITVPLAKNGIIAGCMLVFIPVVGEFVIPELLGGPETLMIGKVL
jgi:hypothetical protein